jgi:hypothetical protein
MPTARPYHVRVAASMSLVFWERDGAIRRPTPEATAKASPPASRAPADPGWRQQAEEGVEALVAN